MFLNVKITGEDGKVVRLSTTDLSLADLQANGERLLDIHDFPRADFIKVFDRKNRKKIITFNTQMGHEGIGHALYHVFFHDQTVPAFGLVEFHVSTPDLEFKCWMRDAGIDAVDVPKHLGVRTWQRYRIIAGEVLKEQPIT